MLDLLWNKTEQWGKWKLAALSGPAFVLSFLAAQWPFAIFLMSPAARNWFFGMAYFAYFDPARLLYDPYKFQVAESTPGIFLKTMAAALVVSIITTRLGLSWGDWMRRMRRCEGFVLLPSQLRLCSSPLPPPSPLAPPSPPH